MKSNLVQSIMCTRESGLMQCVLEIHNSLPFLSFTTGLGKGAAEWLTKHQERHGHSMGVVAVGIDTLSLDKGVSVRFPSHTTLADHNIYGVENLANLDQV